VTETEEITVVTAVRGIEVPSVCPPGETFDYVIQQGDTLYSIAARYGVTVRAILAVNPQITNPNLISVGQMIKVPCPSGMG
ncbi:MAG: LysM domain-containing protein, partial [Clostridia bacterium]|nr:LysM domain-containing protein [Clostridia bacterium]